MNWNEWEFLWRHQPLPPAVDISKLQTDFESRSRRMQRTLRFRDFGEAVAGLVVALTLLALEHRLGGPAWPIIVAIFLTLGVSAFFIFERIRVFRRRLGPDASLLNKVEWDLAELRRQRRLLSQVALWYLLPLFLAELCVTFTIASRAQTWEPQRNPLFLGGCVGFFLLCNGFVWRLNARAVCRQLDPRIAELDALRQSLACL
jgi:hypothetical protein